MKLHCPHCGVKGSAEDSYIGRKVKCPKCQGVFEVLADMASEPPADASFPATLSPLSAEIPSSEADVAIAAAVEDDHIETETETETETEVDASFVEESFVKEAAEALDEPSEDVTAPQPVTTPGAEQEETLDWDDIASEIDLQLAEATMGEEQEGSLQDEPAVLDSFAEDFEKPVDDFDLMEEFPTLDAAAHAENPAEQRDNDQAETAVAESSEEDMLQDGVELEPYGIDRKQCWQCGKEEGVGESFVAKDGRLYCLDCVAVENRQETAAPGQEPISSETPPAERSSDGGKELSNDSTGGYDDEKSTGGTIRQAWAKAWDALARLFGK